METKSNKKKSLKARAKRAFGQLSAFATLATVSAMSMAQSAGDIPDDLASADTFMRTKGLIAVGIAGVITLIGLGVTAAKLPRKGS
ncbi:hypothetical protein [Pseudoxanthomonas winnipegensis]|uniref:Uncharacterized protein n=1 Tax=Pseudoxanthomonas winnipegensis TaxID=2480810 RepID=A0A4Q8M823_9GAMM|nr:hypothetical protein [Pseudoxanthomonas winnipegensis]TAA46281.1 hypothetical protein EA655_00870 [Pseudoxanthomonas winnipegensis]